MGEMFTSKLTLVILPFGSISKCPYADIWAVKMASPQILCEPI